MNKICGNCKSRDLKQIGAVYDQLKVSSSGRAVGVGMSGGKLGVGAMGTSGISQPELVKKIERQLPKKMNIIKLVIFGFLAFISFGPSFTGEVEGVGLILGTIFAILTYKEFTKRQLNKKKNIIKLVIFGFLAFGFFSASFTGEVEGVGLIMGTIFAILTFYEFTNGKNYKKNLDESNRTWYCFSCGQFRIYKK